MTRVMALSLGLSISLASLILAQDAPVPVPAVIPNIVDPNAVNAQSVCPGYTASNVQDTADGVTADLTLAGEACNAYGTDIEALSLTVQYQALDRLHVEILPKYIGAENQSWFILPDSLLTKPRAEDGSAGQGDLEFTWNNEPTFWFQIARKSTRDVIFTTEGTQLVYEDQFIEFVSTLPENYNLYGLGEVIHGFRLGNDLTRTMWAADVGDIIDANVYGSHPVYVETRYFQVDEETGALTYAPNATDTSAQYQSFTHSVFQRNAHAQEILLQDSNITWRALGGTIDLYFYPGPTQDQVTKSYQNSAIGLPAMQQYWTLGFHQCRWGYRNWTDLQVVLDKFAESEIPIETIWTDIDYMKAYRDFENDPVNYGYEEGAQFLSQLHESNRHYIPIIDGGVYVPDPSNASDAYPTFDRGVELDAFLLNPDGSVYIGEVWPGEATWGDFIGAHFNGTGAYQWWINEVSEYHSKVDFDGIWIDMTEIASFCDGSCGSATRPSLDITTAVDTLPDPRDVDFPPYAINNFHYKIGNKTVSPNATHHGGTIEYDYHNLWGYLLMNATYQSLLNVAPRKRPFIIGRSQFAGAGKWAGHWGGDNYSIWPFMYFSIPQALSYSLFGIPMFGPDTCGFSGNATEELCSRWMQLSAFFPFYRNHNVQEGTSQEPYIWPSVAEATRQAMAIRYALLPYIYTTFYLSHSTGSTTMRALTWEFPNEPWLANADRQFLLGGAVMVTPVLTEGATTVDGVFPGVGSGTVWYDWYNQTAITGVSTGQNVTIDAPLGHIPVYVRGGNVLPLQEPGLTTVEVRNSPWSLLVALDANGTASGELYVDDGESVNPDATLEVQLSASTSSLTAAPSGKFVDTNALGNLTVLGVQGTVSAVQLGETTIAVENWQFDEDIHILKISGLDEFTPEGAWSQAWTLTWS